MAGENANSNQMEPGANKIFFPNLNGVRFVAALLVIIQHTEETKIKIKIPTSYRNDGALGALGVTLFFVLSGFLITYLLQSEKRCSNTISLKDFYTRRILRIWPLYYLIIFLGFWFIPTFLPGIGDEGSIKNLSSQLLLDLFFLPNITLILFPPIQFVVQIWSVGVEEQFYLIWPLLVKYFNNLLKPLIAIILFFIAYNSLIFMTYLYLRQIPGTSSDLLNNLYKLLKLTSYTRIDCMAVGGIGAWILFNKKEQLLRVIYSRPVQIVTYLLLISFMVKGTTFGFLAHLPYSILFIIILLNLSSNKLSLVTLNNRLFDYLGKISYGIYMFHSIALALAVKFLTTYYLPYTEMFPKDLQLVSANFVLYALVMLLVTLISAISYSYFEKYFLSKKMKFSTIITGDNVTEAGRP